jgi:anti-sigma factor RsiW
MFAMLSEYLDLELPPEACREMEDHLSGCPPCVEFTQSLRQTIALCRGYQVSEMPGPLSQAARQRLQQAWQRALAARQHNP